jgi:hypothetical protein
MLRYKDRIAQAASWAAKARAYFAPPKPAASRWALLRSAVFLCWVFVGGLAGGFAAQAVAKACCQGNPNPWGEALGAILAFPPVGVVAGASVSGSLYYSCARLSEWAIGVMRQLTIIKT